MTNQTPDDPAAGQLPHRPDGERGDGPPANGDRSERQHRGARQAAFAFVVSMVAAAGLFVVYIAGGQNQLEGILLFIAFGALGLGLAIWVKVIVGRQEVIEDRPLMRSQPEQRRAVSQEYRAVIGETRPGGRRHFLGRLLIGAAGLIGLSLTPPLRSLGPGPRRELFTTPFEAGRRLVTAEGEPILADAVRADQVVTVFPEGHVGAADAQTILVGLRSGRPVALEYETVEGMVAYSKICTHAGCPVGLYRAREGELLCPCHQSTFDVYEAARVLSGPAGRGLPQLPLGVDDQGYLIALSDYPEPVGPSFWNMTSNADRQGDA